MEEESSIKKIFEINFANYSNYKGYLNTEIEKLFNENNEDILNKNLYLVKDNAIIKLNQPIGCCYSVPSSSNMADCLGEEEQNNYFCYNNDYNI